MKSVSARAILRPVWILTNLLLLFRITLMLLLLLLLLLAPTLPLASAFPVPIILTSALLVALGPWLSALGLDLIPAFASVIKP